MNFVLHHHLAALDARSGVTGIGAMLPDLWRMADRRVRPARPSCEAPSGRVVGVVGALLAGVRHHLDTDAWFHASPYFVEGERDTLRALRGSGAEATRLGLFAHVVWEMCLDGALVRRVGLEPILTELRGGFEAAAGGPSAEVVELHHFERVVRGPDERAAFEARMSRIVAELSRGPWIEGYQRGDGLAERLGGVRVRLGLAPLSPGDHERIARALDAIAHRADDALEGLLAAPDRPHAA